MQEFFTKTRLTEKQLGHRLWVNNKETKQTPPDLDNLQPATVVDLTSKEEITMDTDPVHIPSPPGLEQTIPHPKEVHRETIPELPVQAPNETVDLAAAPYKPTHRLVGKQTPPQHPIRAIVAAMLHNWTTSHPQRNYVSRTTRTKKKWSQS
eukprot:4531378-Amphidinium_carterae.1